MATGIQVLLGRSDVSGWGAFLKVTLNKVVDMPNYYIYFTATPNL